tara:strand:- start:8995 stop:9483 length:489 start_codon:yes stop_codon:yes gene_type:complete
MPEKVTKDEKIAELLKKATEKAVELIGNYDDFNQEDLTGEEVKLSRPKATKVPDAKGSDEEKTKIRDEVISKESRRPFEDEDGYMTRPKRESVLGTIYAEIMENNMPHKLGVFFNENKKDIPTQIVGEVEKTINQLAIFEDKVGEFLTKYDYGYGGDATKLD